MPVRRMAAAAVVTIALLAAAGLQSPAAVAAPAPGALSTVGTVGNLGNLGNVGNLGTAEAPAPATTCVADIPRVRHVVLFPAGTGTAAARVQIEAACGRLVGYYPEIAVAVASSADGTFADRMGRDRAYSARAEGFTGTERPEPAAARSGAQSVRTGARVGGHAEAGAADRSGEQWDMTMIGADQARARQPGSPQVLVGVLDSGIDPDHPELAAALDRSASAGCVSGVPDTSPEAWRPSSEHGTHVAGIIAAAGDGVGVTGVAPGVRIAAVKVVDASGFIYPEAAVCGFMWAARTGMRVTNSSYFVDPWLYTCRDTPGQAVVYEALRRAVDYATAHGVLSVAAVGNENADLAGARSDDVSPNNSRHSQARTVDASCAVLPAQLPGVLAVSAVGAARAKSSYSSYGAGVVGVAAPGGDLRQRAAGTSSGCVLSTVPGGYRSLCGTSMAAPHVTGVAALVASAHPDLAPSALARIMESSATPLGCPRGRYDPDGNGTADAICTAAGARTSFYGGGLVNADAAVAAAVAAVVAVAHSP